MKTLVKNREITIGTDVEVGLIHHGVHTLIPATTFNTPFEKSRPEPLRSEGISTPVGTFHRDNITVEFQSLPCATPAKLYANICNINTVLGQWYQTNLDCSLLYLPCLHFRDDEMVALPEAQELGCDPDFCAYQNGEQQAPPDVHKMGLMRVCSGHVHIGGITDMSDAQKRMVVQWMDMLAGVEFALYESHYDAQAYQRREFYGQPGRFRYKPYGVECRTFSNAWVQKILDGYNTASLLFTAVGIAVDAVDKELIPGDFFEVEELNAACCGNPEAPTHNWEGDMSDAFDLCKGGLASLREAQPDIKAWSYV